MSLVLDCKVVYKMRKRKCGTINNKINISRSSVVGTIGRLITGSLRASTSYRGIEINVARYGCQMFRNKTVPASTRACEIWYEELGEELHGDPEDKEEKMRSKKKHRGESQVRLLTCTYTRSIVIARESLLLIRARIASRRVSRTELASSDVPSHKLPLYRANVTKCAVISAILNGLRSFNQEYKQKKQKKNT